MTSLLATASALDVTVSPGGNLQSALDTVGNAGGGTVYVNSGSYNISTSLKVPNNTKLKGVTTRPVIQLASAKNVPVFKSSVAAFNTLTFDYLAINGGLTNAQMDAGTYNGTHGINLGGTGVYGSNAYTYNCNITNASQGIVYGRVNNGRLQGVNLTNCGGAGSPGLHNVYIADTDPFYAGYVNSSNCRTGMGFKITDFYNSRTETSQLVERCVFNNNFDRGTAVYDIAPITLRNNTCNNNSKSGINLLRCGNVSLTDNTATGNPLVADVSYDIWLNNCTGVTQSGNTYGTKRGF